MWGHQAEQTWQAALLARHAHPFRSGQVCISGYPFVGDGWRDLVEHAVARIAEVLSATTSGSVTVVEIKSKYATLRVYWTGTGLTKPSEDAIAEVIALAEARSACTCETCGDAGVLHQVGGQLLTACGKHALGKPVPVPGGWENVHLVRGTRGGKTALLVCRRYVRASDAFVDVDPAALGIDE